MLCMENHDRDKQRATHELSLVLERLGEKCSQILLVFTLIFIQ